MTQPGIAPKARLSHLTTVDSSCRSLQRTLLRGDCKRQVFEVCRPWIGTQLQNQAALTWSHTSVSIHTARWRCRSKRGVVVHIMTLTSVWIFQHVFLVSTCKHLNLYLLTVYNHMDALIVCCDWDPNSCMHPGKWQSSGFLCSGQCQGRLIPKLHFTDTKTNSKLNWKVTLSCSLVPAHPCRVPEERERCCY